MGGSGGIAQEKALHEIVSPIAPGLKRGVRPKLSHAKAKTPEKKKEEQATKA